MTTTVAEVSINPKIAQVAVQMTARLLATFAVVEGVVIIIGGRGRWSDLGHQVALAVPGAPATWGVALLVAGAIAFVGSVMDRMHTVALGLFLGGIWSFFFSVAFGASAVLYDQATTTAAWTYGALAIIYFLISVAYHQSRRPHRESSHRSL